MAIYHLSAKPVQRSKGESAVAGAAYRAAEKLHDERRNKTEDYTRKRGVVASVIIAPENAPEWVYDRAELWNRAELAEKRKDAQPAREIRLALPHELTDEQRADLVFRYARDMFVSRGMVADVSIHRPDRHGDERNDHSHIYLTMRELDGEQFSTKKQRDWNRTELLEYWREQWAEYQNAALEDAGFDVRVDHRTLEAQGIDREATTHLGKAASAKERQGEKTERGGINREIEEHNYYLDDLVNELAAVEAEIAQELAKEFTEEAGPEESIFDNSLSRKFEQELREKGYIGEPFSEVYDLDEELDEPEYLYDQDEAPEPDYSPIAFTRAQPGESIFDSPISKRFEREIREYGEVKEYGLGKNWYDRTVAFWQDLYSDTASFVKDTWQKYIMEGRDRDKSLDREGEGGLLDSTVDRVKGFWQKYIAGSDKDPDRDDLEPDR